MSFSDLERSPREDAGLGFLYSVLGSAGFATIGTVAVFLLPESDLASMANYLLLGFLLATVVIGVAAAAMGLPLTWLLARLGWERAWTYPLAGLVAGSVLVLLFPLLPNASRTGHPLEYALFLPVGALPGFVCGALWWLTYRRHQQRTAHE